jgi:ubiquinone/menaquinone biosynthesis C-methylase UbiE
MNVRKEKLMLDHFHQANQAPSGAGTMQGWGKTYDWITAFLFGGYRREQDIRQGAVHLAQVKPGSRILDVGCGTGTLTLAAARAAGSDGKVWGIDVAEDMLQAARQKAANAGLPVHFQNASITELPFADGQMDIVLSSLMIHHLVDEDTRRKGLAEVKRVLRPGGILMITEFKPPKNGLLKLLVRLVLGNSMLRFDNQRLIQILEETGYRVEVPPSRSRLITYIRAAA